MSPDPRFPFPSYPKGWFAVAFSDDVGRGEVRRLHYFGRELIAFRGESGRVTANVLLANARYEEHFVVH